MATPPFGIWAQRYAWQLKGLFNWTPATVGVLLSMLSRWGNDGKVWVGQRALRHDTRLSNAAIASAYVQLQRSFWDGHPVMLLDRGGPGGRQSFKTFPGLIELHQALEGQDLELPEFPAASHLATPWRAERCSTNVENGEAERCSTNVGRREDEAVLHKRGQRCSTNVERKDQGREKGWFDPRRGETPPHPPSRASSRHQIKNDQASSLQKQTTEDIPAGTAKPERRRGRRDRERQSETAPAEKRCACCKEHYPATMEYFASNRGLVDGLDHYCKGCRSRSTARTRAKRKRARDDQH